MKIIPTLLAALATIGLNLSSQAQIVYIDADQLSNTYDTATGSVNTGWYETGTGANNSSDWRLRSSFGNGSEILEGGYNSDDVELTTQITGLADGNYDVWAFFWDASGSNEWNIAAGLTSGSLTTYSFDGLGDTDSEVDAGTLSFTTSVLASEGDRTLYGINLGQAVVSGGGGSGSINVYIDNGGSSPDDRTWYDGVGYQAVPEASSTLLLSLILSLCLIRRRR